MADLNLSWVFDRLFGAIGWIVALTLWAKRERRKVIIAKLTEQQISAYDQVLNAFEALRKNAAATLREYETMCDHPQIVLPQADIENRQARVEESEDMYDRLRDTVAVGPGQLSAEASGSSEASWLR